MPTTVINLKTYKGGGYIRIDRRTGLGNPFVIGKDGDRQECLDKYRKYFYLQIATNCRFKAAIEGLRGKILACWCVEKPISYIRPDKICHGEIIMEYLARNPQQ